MGLCRRAAGPLAPRWESEILVIRGVGRLDAAVFAVLLAFGPPLLAGLYARLAALIWTWVGEALYLVFVSAFLAQSRSISSSSWMYEQ